MIWLNLMMKTLNLLMMIDKDNIYTNFIDCKVVYLTYIHNYTLCAIISPTISSTYDNEFNKEP